MRDIHYSRSAQRALVRMPRDRARQIVGKIELYAENPASLANNVRALKGYEGLIRLRVGDWRVIMRDGVVLLVLEIAARGSAYKE